MVDAYNYFVGGYIPKISPRTYVHNRKELKSKYKSIVSLNNANPLAMFRMSPETQIYALDVKEISMELGEAAQEALNAPQEEGRERSEDVAQLFNKLLTRSDEYGNLKNKPSRPGAELRNLVAEYRDELEESGFHIQENGYLSIQSEKSFRVPESFMNTLRDKCEYMSMNPMEYVDKRIYSYAHLNQGDIGNSYMASVYTGMLFNSYC